MRGRQAVATLTNKSGGSVVAGDLVIVDSTTDESFTTTTTQNAEVSIGIVQETIANNAAGRVLLYGYAPTINTAAVSQPRGGYMFHSSNAKTAIGSNTRAAGAFGQFLKNSTTPSGWVWGVGDQTATGGGGGSSTVFTGSKAYSATTQSITDDTPTAVAFELEEYDTDAFHDLVTNNSRFTVPAGKGGKYRLTGGVTLAAGASPVSAQLRWRLNGTTNIRAATYWIPSSGTLTGEVVTTDTTLVAGDYVELMAYQDSSGSRNIGHATAPEAQSFGAVSLIGT